MATTTPPNNELSSVTTWFRPENRQDLDKSDEILRDAFERALKVHREQEKKHHKDDIPSFKSSTMESVLAEIAKAEQRREEQRSSKWRLTKAMSSGWITTVNKINTFSTVIDVLASSHPEYAAPVWGTIKFLFLATMNHQELANKISEAFTAIGDALPEVDFLASQLYPVPRIQSTLATIYTHIIDFCIRALTWYRKTRGNFLRKTLAAIKDPWALEFDEVVRQIQRTVARIREQAAIAHQAETRHVSYMMSEVRTEVMNIRKERNMESSLLNNMSSIANTVLSPSNQPSILGKVPLVVEAMSKYFSSVPFQPEKALVLGAAVRDRRRARGHPVSDQLWTSIKLRNWISKPGSALVQVKGTLATADASRDFALDMIELAKAVGLLLAWCVSSQLPSTSSARSIKVEDIWRSLVWQVLEKNSDGSSYRNLAESDFASCSTEDDWIALLVAVLAEMSHVVLVIDCHQDERGIRETVGKFWRAVTKQKVKTTVKMLLLTYSNPGTSMPVILPNEDVQLYTVALGQDRRPGMARTLLQGNPRGRRQAVARRGGGASQLRPFMTKLLEDGEHAADNAS